MVVAYLLSILSILRIELGLFKILFLCNRCQYLLSLIAKTEQGREISLTGDSLH